MATALALAGCGGGTGNESAGNGVLPPGPLTNASDVTADAIPAEVRALAEKTVPGIVIAEAERKEREGRVYYDVEGKRADGSEVELDILQEGTGFTVVEVQRDIAWADVPAVAVTAVTAAKAAPGSFEPVRVIESTQPDGSIVYELFAPASKKGEPAMEIQVKDGKATVLGTRSAH
jgi:hypothetical protein